MKDSRSQPQRGGGPRSSPPPQSSSLRKQEEKKDSILPLPQDTQQLVKKTKSQCENVGLFLERYIPWDQERGDLTLKETKKQLLQHVAKIPANDLAKAIQALTDRAEAMCNALRAGGYEVKGFRQKPTWRLIAGLGGASVLETAMTLHPVYGLPIIPGSALKGVARAYAEAKGTPQEDIDAVFGPERKKGEKKEAAAGKVIFFDAFPTTVPKFEPDIMNVHYGDYYTSKGTKPPADYSSPTPILFLTVGKNTEFRFIIAARTKEPKSAEWVAKAEEWLKGGLKGMGVGAKTMVGYGYFEAPLKQSQGPIAPARR